MHFISTIYILQLIKHICYEIDKSFEKNIEM